MMRKIAVVLILCCTTAFAAEVPASEASIKEMLQVTEARKMVDGMFPQIEALMKSAMQQAAKGRTLSPSEQKAADHMLSEIMTEMKAELNWDDLEPLYVSVYQKSFTQSEMDGMLAFYKSPAGAAVIRKLPVVVQQTMIAMQQRMGPMMQRMQKAIQDSVSQIDAADGKKG
jgi:uncharacterized protein